MPSTRQPAPTSRHTAAVSCTEAVARELTWTCIRSSWRISSCSTPVSALIAVHNSSSYREIHTSAARPVVPVVRVASCAVTSAQRNSGW